MHNVIPIRCLRKVLQFGLLGSAGVIRFWGYQVGCYACRLAFLSGLGAALFLTIGLVLPASAAHHRRHLAAVSAVTAFHGHGHHGLLQMLASATDPEKDAALVVDGATGKVLYARNETPSAIPPRSPR